MRKRWPYKGGSLGELVVKFEDPICTRGSESDEELAEEKTVILRNTVDANWAACTVHQCRIQVNTFPFHISKLSRHLT
jgi:hypothetical protein